jgi:hypothetical protein
MVEKKSPRMHQDPELYRFKCFTHDSQHAGFSEACQKSTIRKIKNKNHANNGQNQSMPTIDANNPHPPRPWTTELAQ